MLMLSPAVLSYGQNPLKYKPGAGPSGAGVSTNPQTVIMKYDDGTTYTPAVNVTYTISNQQFASVEGNPGVPGTLFGAGIGTDNTIQSEPLYRRLNTVGSSLNDHYSTLGISPGINTANDYGLNLFLSTDALITGNSENIFPTDQDVYYADLTVSFSRPVSDPILNFTGLGGYFSMKYRPNNNVPYKFYTLGFAAQFELKDTYTLERLSGSNYFSVAGKSIKNTAVHIGSNTQGAPIDVEGDRINNITRHAASGSVRVLGKNITSVSFKILLHPDGGMITNSNGNTVSPDQELKPLWSTGASHPAGIRAKANGDNVLLSTTLLVNAAKGKVFDDNNAGVPDGRPYQGAKVNLYDMNNVLVSTAITNAAGEYQFNDILFGNYKVVIDKPQGYEVVGNKNGTTSDTLLVTIANAPNDGLDFGINQPPVAVDDLLTDQTAGTPASISVLDNDYDPNNGVLDAGKISLVPPAGATDIRSNENNAITSFGVPGAGVWTLNPDGLLTFTPEPGFQHSPAPINYYLTDEAGLKSNIAKVNITYSTPLPVQLRQFKAYASDCSAQLEWSTAAEAGFHSFDVERSYNGINFEHIGTVLAKGSNSRYAFTDPAGMTGKRYYRLKLKDHDGYVAYSAVQNVTVTCMDKAIAVFPNPASNYLNITGASSYRMITIYNTSGRQVKQFQVQPLHTIRLDITDLPAGQYNIHFIADTPGEVKQAVFLKY